METRANYVLIGVFTLAVVFGVFGFVYWFQNIGGTGERAFYRVVFDGSVSGLRTGATVLFNGIRVGEVTDLKLNPEHPKQVMATLSIDKSVAVRADVVIGLEFQGLTGVASVSLKGGSTSAAVVAGVGSKEVPPALTAPPGATTDVTQAARDTLRRLDDFIAENQTAFHSAIENIDKFTGALARNSAHVDMTLESIDKFSSALARNSERIDKIAEGLQNLTGGADGKGGEINEAARSIRTLADNLDKRTADLAVDISKLTNTGRRTLNTVDKAAKNFDENPSRIIWGGAPPDAKATKKK